MGWSLSESPTVFDGLRAGDVLRTFWALRLGPPTKFSKLASSWSLIRVSAAQRVFSSSSRSSWRTKASSHTWHHTRRFVYMPSPTNSKRNCGKVPKALFRVPRLIKLVKISRGCANGGPNFKKRHMFNKHYVI
jgi:hypothetical protein